MTDPQEPPRHLVGEWAVCAVAAAAARFVPVPLLDDAVRERATRIAVARTLRTHGRRYPTSAVEPLYGDVEGGLRAAARYVASVPRRILFFPARKYVAVFGAVRGVPNDAMRVLLLGRTVHRRLSLGGLQDGDRKALHEEAERIRSAFDEAVLGVNLRLLQQALRDALSHRRQLRAAAVDFARRLVDRDEPEDQQEVTDEVADGAARVRNTLYRPDTDEVADGAARVRNTLYRPDTDEVADGAARVRNTLYRPDVAAVLAEFDARFDAELAARNGAYAG